MRHAAAALAPLFSLAVVLAPDSAAARAADSGRDESEARAIEGTAKRLYQIENTEHSRWYRDLKARYGGLVTEPKDDDEYGAWFDLLAGGEAEWRRPPATSPALRAMYDKVAEYRRLGNVPSIRRDEFMRYADRVLDRSQSRARRDLPDYEREADRVFRVLDQDKDEIISGSEMTRRLARAGLKADADLNGRIDRNEYRAYFESQAAAEVKVVAAKQAEEEARKAAEEREKAPAKPDGDDDSDFPDFLAEIDADNDGQVALHEWLRAGGDIEYFHTMDLNDDGLLPPAEYRRFAAMKAADPDEPPAKD